MSKEDYNRHLNTLYYRGMPICVMPGVALMIYCSFSLSATLNQREISASVNFSPRPFSTNIDLFTVLSIVVCVDISLDLWSFRRSA